MTSRRIPFAALALLAFCAFVTTPAVDAAGPQRKDFREVEGVSAPVYRQRSAEAWKTHGRFVGQISNPPGSFVMKYFKAGDKNGEPLKVEEHTGSISVYESGWLPPGKYTISIEAEGFTTYFIETAEIRKGFDCIMDIKFGTHVYHIF